MTDWRLAVVFASMMLGAAGAYSSFSSADADVPNVPTNDAANVDPAVTPDANVTDASATCVPFIEPLVATFDDGFGDLNDKNPLGGGTVAVDSGVLFAHVPWAISRAETTKRYALASDPFRSARLSFSLKDVVQPPIDYVAAGCGLELTTAGGTTFVRFELKTGNFTLDDEVRYPDTGIAESGTGPVLSVISANPRTFRVDVEMVIDDAFTHVTSSARLDGGDPRSKETPLFGVPTNARLRCGVHNFSVAEASSTKPGYEIAIDDVRLELCR